MNKFKKLVGLLLVGLMSRQVFAGIDSTGTKKPKRVRAESSKLKKSKKPLTQEELDKNAKAREYRRYLLSTKASIPQIKIKKIKKTPQRWASHDVILGGDPFPKAPGFYAHEEVDKSLYDHLNDVDARANDYVGSLVHTAWSRHVGAVSLVERKHVEAYKAELLAILDTLIPEKRESLVLPHCAEGMRGCFMSKSETALKKEIEKVDLALQQAHAPQVPHVSQEQGALGSFSKFAVLGVAAWYGFSQPDILVHIIEYCTDQFMTQGAANVIAEAFLGGRVLVALTLAMEFLRSGAANNVLQYMQGSSAHINQHPISYQDATRPSESW